MHLGPRKGSQSLCGQQDTRRSVSWGKGTAATGSLAGDASGAAHPGGAPWQLFQDRCGRGLRASGGRCSAAGRGRAGTRPQTALSSDGEPLWVG